MSETPRVINQGDFCYIADEGRMKRVIIININQFSFEVIDPEHTRTTIKVSHVYQSEKEYYESLITEEHATLSRRLREAYQSHNTMVAYYKRKIKEIEQKEAEHERKD